MTGTPLAFLFWVHHLCEWDFLTPAKLDEGLDQYLWQRFATVPLAVVRAVVPVFSPNPNTPTDRAKVLEACGGNEAVLKQLQDRQVILPVDFWHPTQFTLDPELWFLHPSRQPRCDF